MERVFIQVSVYALDRVSDHHRPPRPALSNLYAVTIGGVGHRSVGRADAQIISRVPFVPDVPDRSRYPEHRNQLRRSDFSHMFRCSLLLLKK
jgi:hypothetical protein